MIEAIRYLKIFGVTLGSGDPTGELIRLQDNQGQSGEISVLITWFGLIKFGILDARV